MVINKDPSSNPSPEELFFQKIISEIHEFKEEFITIDEYFNPLSDLLGSKKQYRLTKNKEQYDQEVEEIKKKYFIQCIALAKTKELLETAILNGFKNKDFLLKIVNEMRKYYHFNNEQTSKLEEIIDFFTQYKESVDEYFSSICKSDYNELFRRIFKEELINYPDVEISIGPYGVEVIGSEDSINKLNNCFNILGFAGIHRNPNFKPKFFLLYSGFTRNEYGVISHERHHNIFNFLKDQIYPNLTESSEVDLVSEIMRHEGDKDAQKEIYLTYFRKIRSREIHNLADELLAMISGGRKVLEIDEFLPSPYQLPYNYFWEWNRSTGTIGASSNPNIFVFTKDMYRSLKMDIRYLKHFLVKDNPYYQYLDDDPYPQVMESKDVDLIIGDIKTKPVPFIPDKTIVNEARKQVFNDEYLKILIENIDAINYFLSYFPDKRNILLNQLSVTNFKFWIPTIMKLFDYYYKV